MTLLVHLVIHLPDSVRLHGPLQETSTFCFESFNSIVLKNIHGTYRVEKGIAEDVPRYQILQSRLKIMRMHLKDRLAFKILKRLKVRIRVYFDPYTISITSFE